MAVQLACLNPKSFFLFFFSMSFSRDSSCACPGGNSFHPPPLSSRQGSFDQVKSTAWKSFILARARILEGISAAKPRNVCYCPFSFLLSRIMNTTLYFALEECLAVAWEGLLCLIMITSSWVKSTRNTSTPKYQRIAMHRRSPMPLHSDGTNNGNLS